MNEDESTVMSVLAFSLMQSARPEKAASLLDALDVLAPGRPDTLRALALAQIRSGKAEQALRTLDRLAMAGGAGAAFHLMRAQALQALNRPIEASVAMKTFLQMRPAAPEHDANQERG